MWIFLADFPSFSFPLPLPHLFFLWPSFPSNMNIRTGGSPPRQAPRGLHEVRRACVPKRAGGHTSRWTGPLAFGAERSVAGARGKGWTRDGRRRGGAARCRLFAARRARDAASQQVLQREVLLFHARSPSRGVSADYGHARMKFEEEGWGTRASSCHTVAHRGISEMIPRFDHCRARAPLPHVIPVRHTVSPPI